MKYQYLFLLFLILSPVFIQTSEAYLTIPPTRAFYMINGTGGNVTANSYADFVELVAGTGITVGFDYTLHEVTISATGSSLNSIHQIGNVTETGCGVNQILKVNSTGFFACGDDNTGAASGISSINTVSSNATILQSNSTTSATLKNISDGNYITWFNNTSSLIANLLPVPESMITNLTTDLATFFNNISETNTGSGNFTLIGSNSSQRVALKTISQGTGISLTNDENNIVISSTITDTTGFTNIANTNSGNLTSIIGDNSTVSNRATFKTLSEGTGIDLTNDANNIVITNTVTDTGFTNITPINSVNQTLIGDNTTSATTAAFKTLSAGTGIGLQSSAGNIIIENTLSSGSGFTTISSEVSPAGNMTVLAENSTGTRASFKTLSAGTGIQIDNGTQNLKILSTITQGITSVSTISQSNATLIADNSTIPNKVIVKTLSAGTGIQIDNGSNSIIIKNTGPTSGPTVLSGGNITTSSGTTWIKIWNIAMTATSGNRIDGKIIASTAGLATAVQFYTNLTAGSNSYGTCLWATPTAATTNSFNLLNASGSATPSGGGTAQTAWVNVTAQPISFDCGLYSGNTPGTLGIFFRSETAGKSVSVLPGSFYIKTP